MPPESPRAQRRKKDPFHRKPEAIAYDVLDGPFTRAFHRFYRRREISAITLKPYPWFIGGIHRFARELDVAQPLEIVYIAAAPFVVLFFTLWGRLGVPLGIQAYGLLATCCYFGFLFVDLVFLDRRLDSDEYQRVKAYRHAGAKAREGRLLERREAKMNRAAATEAARESLARGQAKASTPHADGTNPASTTSSPKIKLDELLDPR